MALSIKPFDLEGMEIEIPSLDVQKKVASILKVLDNKKEANTQKNRNLWEQVRALYKS